MLQVDELTMYGVLVGKLQHDVLAGQGVTTSNTKHATEGYAYRQVQYTWHPLDVSKFLNRTFNGYKRSDGSVGTANYWLFVPRVLAKIVMLKCDHVTAPLY